MRNNYCKIVGTVIIFILIVIYFIHSGKKLQTEKNSAAKKPVKNVSLSATDKNQSTPEEVLPAPPAINTPFTDEDLVSFGEFNGEISRQMKRIASSANLKEEYRAFTNENRLPVSEKLYIDFVRGKILFEASRDYGLWHIQWDITNREPNADNIREQWKRQTGEVFNGKITAIAECDEISALFSFLCRKQGVNGTGLFWPTDNHTVAVWKLKTSEGKEIRIVIPTTQIFLDNKGLFGKTKFDPWKQSVIYDYTRDDISDSFLIPAGLARFFIIQIEKYGGASEEVLHYFRNVRESVFLGNISRRHAAQEVTGVRNEYLEVIMNQKKENPDKTISYTDIYAIDYFLKDFLEID